MITFNKIDFLADFVLILPFGALLSITYQDFTWDVVAFILAFSVSIIIRDSIKLYQAKKQLIK